ncbi:MAG: MBL fold metallo-hydrolase RNA specificity domain-containing protein [Planctomycetota bacterium]|jgi:metallo-beta-lactamase family protein
MGDFLQFFGAARYVTGSKHLVEYKGKRILFDCGMVQGPRQISVKANSKLPFEASSIDAVVLSHAHVDHSGSLPRLVKCGFEGKIHCTEATKSLLGVLLPDSAHIQAQDAKYLRKKGQHFEPPYDEDDVRKTIKRARGSSYHEVTEVLPGVTVQFFDAGHILGSAMVLLTLGEGADRKRVLFSGDLGRKDLPILRDPDSMPECDYLITESTYGDRLHPPRADLQNSLRRLMEEATSDGGRVLIPAFSVGRTQNVLYFLGNLMSEGKIPKMPIYIDSPLSTKATKVMAAHSEVFDAETKALLDSGHHPFFFDGVRYVADVSESMSLNSLRSGVIIAASGMCEAGRILHHIKQSAGRPEDCILMVGYQAQGTLGRRLLDGFESVKIFGERYRVRCRVRSMGGLSAHADYQEMLSMLRPLAKTCRKVFVVHGEEDPALIFAGRLEEAGFRSVEVPVLKQKFSI